MQRVWFPLLVSFCIFVVVDNLGKSYKLLDKPVSGTKEVKEASPFPQPPNSALYIKRVSLKFGMFRNWNVALPSLVTVKGLSTNVNRVR
jgi:hypothetical protein